METVFRLKVSELNENFIQVIKQLFKEEIEIVIHATTDFGLNAPESRGEYLSRLLKAKSNVEQNKNVVSFTETELEKFTKNLSGE